MWPCHSVTHSKQFCDLVTQLTIPDTLRNSLTMTLRVSDWQSKSDLDSIRNSGDSFYLVKHAGYQSYRRPTTIYLLYFRLLYFLFGGAPSMPITGDIHLLSQDAEAIRPTHDEAWIGLWRIPQICQVGGTTTLFRPVREPIKNVLAEFVC